ncbi:hypothetical protein Y032_0079g1282 [Ancylostoma ceylanicum]|uniref:Uncharacterized protein n=1 Tax=Ancylostoma ceylanicum TaxID=53326 RepID=A0A016TU95_9BILA|nr:hypothetical protein Y032_0079g1282 [Ancylostoma ceylanicum]
MYNHCKVTGYNYTCPNTMNNENKSRVSIQVSSSDPQYVAAQICQGLGEVWTNSLSTTSPINVSPSNIQP